MRGGKAPVSIVDGLYKTELCRNWRFNGYCSFGSICKFAHGDQELRPVTRASRYKTTPCNKWFNLGFCPYGKRCQFLHGDEPIGGTSEEIPCAFTQKKSPGAEEFLDKLDAAAHMIERKKLIETAEMAFTQMDRMKQNSSMNPGSPLSPLYYFPVNSPNHNLAQDDYPAPELAQRHGPVE